MSSVWFRMVYTGLHWDLASSAVRFISWSGIPAWNPIWWETQNLTRRGWPSSKVCHKLYMLYTGFISAWHIPPYYWKQGIHQCVITLSLIKVSDVTWLLWITSWGRKILFIMLGTDDILLPEQQLMLNVSRDTLLYSCSNSSGSK